MFVELLPIPLNVNIETIKQIESYINQLDDSKIDAIIYSLYGISTEEISFIESLI